MASGILRTFKPLAATQNVSAGVAAQTITFNYVNGTRALRVHNSGSVVVFASFIGTGATGSAATLTDSMPLPAGGVEVFTIPVDCTGISLITASGTATVYTTVGEGL